MKRELGSEQNCSASRSAVDSGLIVLAVATFRQTHHAISTNTPEDIDTHVIGKWFAGTLGRAILLVVITALRNRLDRRR
ncbi:hypothetical protein AA309_14380 [Microvirga vignae]|uniref:Uncharacterized protein n=1 Tax=Microvirga vignae TaxID=1225564 RepID=A0A0H1RCE2_9HYPH|nr:hypothetical protein AA309_14380 [Microvirga vignae]